MSGDEVSDKRLTKRAQRTENTRRRILDASVNLFMEQGYEKTTTRQILNEVGILNGSLYNIYKSKEDIFSDIVINALEEAMRHASDSLPENTPIRVRLAYIFHMQLYFAARSQRIAELLTIAHERWDRLLRLPHEAGCLHRGDRVVHREDGPRAEHRPRQGRDDPRV